MVEDDLDLRPPVGRRADGAEQILTSNGSGRRDRARLAALSVLGNDMVCDGASQTSESRRERVFFGVGARGTRRPNRWPGGAAIDVCAAGPELANEVREPHQPGGHERFANGGLSDSPGRPPRLPSIFP